MGDVGEDIKQNPWALPSALALGGSAGLLRGGGLVGTPVGAVLGGLGAYGLGYGDRRTQRQSQAKLADALKNVDPNTTYPQVVQKIVGAGGSLTDADEFWKQFHPKAEKGVYWFNPKTGEEKQSVTQPGPDFITSSFKPDKPGAPNEYADWLKQNPGGTVAQFKAAGREPKQARYTFQPDGKGGFVRINEDTLEQTPVSNVTKAPAKEPEAKLPANLPKTHTWTPASSLSGAYYGTPNPGSTATGSGVAGTSFMAKPARALLYIPSKGVYLNPGDPIPGTSYRWDGQP